MNPDTSHAVVYTVRLTLGICGGVVWCVYAAWGEAVNQLMVEDNVSTWLEEST